MGRRMTSPRAPIAHCPECLEPNALVCWMDTWNDVNEIWWVCIEGPCGELFSPEDIEEALARERKGAEITPGAYFEDLT